MAPQHTGGRLSTFFVGVTMAAYLIAPIRTCPVNCNCTVDPLIVKCDGQGFTTIPKELPKNTKVLSLSYNKITILDLRMLYDLELLERVDFSSNEIKTIYGSFESFKNLYLIDLSYNKIEVVPWKTFGNLSQMNLFKLTGNPFNCDCNQWNTDLCDCSEDILKCTCNMQWLQVQVQKYPTLSWDVICESPAKAHGKAIEEIKFSPYWCETKYHRIVGLTVGVGLPVLVLIITAIVLLCRRRPYRCWNTCRRRRMLGESYSHLKTAEGDSLSPSARKNEADRENARNGEDTTAHREPNPMGNEEAEIHSKNEQDGSYEENEVDKPVEVHRLDEPDRTQPPAGVYQEHRLVSERLPPEIANTVVTEPQLNTLAMKLGKEWESLASHLGVIKDKVDKIKLDNIGNTDIQILKMLLAWKAKQKSKATVGNLVKELEAFDDGAIDEDKFIFFLESSESWKHEEPSDESETNGPLNYNNEERSAPARGVVHPDRTATFQVNGVKVHFSERSVERVRTISVEVEHPVVRNQRQRDILQDGVCGPLITVVQSSDQRFQTPVTVTVDLQYPAGSKQSEPNEDLRWHLFRQTGTSAWEDVADFSPQVTDATIEYKTSEFCRHWLVKLTEDAVLSFMQRMNDFIEDYFNPLVVLVMYPGQNGTVVLDCLHKADPSLKHLLLKSGYNQRCVPMDQTEEVKARLEGNIQFTGGDSMTEEITFQHPKTVRGDLNKKEVFLSLRDSADPNHLGYVTYSIAQREVTKMPISITELSNLSGEVLEFCRLLTSSLGVNFIPLHEQHAEMDRLKKISEWETNFASRQSCRLSDKADDLINRRKRAVCKIDWPTDGHGTGFLIGTKEIMTNHHVLQLIREAYERNRNTLEYKVTFHISGTEHTIPLAIRLPLSSDHLLDYAILELVSEPDPSLEIPTLGQYISRIPESTRFAVVVGHPFGGSKQLDYCHMASVDEKFAIHVKFGNPQAPSPQPDLVSYHSHEMYFGSSGSPGFNTDGNVILLHTKGYFPYYNSRSVIEQGIKLTSIVEHARSNLTEEKFGELFPTFVSHPQGNPLLGGDETMEVD